MRQRVEDLGRITVMVSNLMRHELFDERPRRNKEFAEWFEEQPQEFKEEWLHSTVYRISEVEEKLGDIYEIATGQDYLNEARDE